MHTSVAEFIDPDWWDKANSGIGLSIGPPGYTGCRADTTSYAGVDFIPTQGSMNSAREL